MNHASADVIIWLFVIVFAVVKSLGKYFAPGEESADTDGTSKVPPVQARPHTVARPVIRAAPAEPRPTVAGPKAWDDPGRDLRDFMKQLARPAPPALPAPVVPPPIPEPVVAKPPPAPVAAAAPVTAPITRSTQWAEALRDRENIRNIIISAEIIGRPKGI